MNKISFMKIFLEGFFKQFNDKFQLCSTIATE